MNKTYLSAIKEMVQVDQMSREAAAGPGITKENLIVYAIDQIHNTRLKRLIEEFGYPTAETVGTDGIKDYWLLIQHQDSDPSFQLRILDTCDFEPKEKAYLTDRVLVNAGKLQRYGTQMYRSESGELVLRPIEDEESVAERRKEIGLESLDVYTQKMKERDNEQGNKKNA